MPSNLEYESLKVDHVCQCNFQGSFAKREIIDASRIFLRTEKNRNLQYTYIGDGVSKGFMCLKDRYGEISVSKMECIGHVKDELHHV